MSKQELKQKGFTIIEVVLVLAIAALIFLMVFIALPALQRNQRDQARKEVVGKVSSAVTTYQSNKRGTQPANGSAIAGYVDGTSADGVKSDNGSVTGSGSDTLIDNNYLVIIGAFDASAIGAADTNVVQVFTGAKCNDSGDAAIGGSKRNAAIIVKMENGSSYFCQAV